MIKTLYSACYNDSGHPFNVLAENVEVATTPSDMMEENSALVIWGGSDINPKLYGHARGNRTGSGGQRDDVEWALLQQGIKMGIPIFGVCRGGQMLCAAAGGYLIQHVNNHAGSNHTVVTSTGETLQVNSIHHQMMMAPKEVGHELLAWSSHRLSDVYLYKDDQNHPPPEKEPEFIYFPTIKGFAIQWHPEGMSRTSPATTFIMKAIHERLSVFA